MDPRYVHGSTPHRAEAAASAANSSMGATPRLSAADRERSQQLAMLFAAQVQQSMMASLDGLAGEGDAAADGDEGGGDALGRMSGLDGMAASGGGLEALGSLYSASLAPGATVTGLQSKIAAALQQAQAGGQLGGFGVAGTDDGTGMDAMLAQQLLASLEPSQATGAAISVGAASSSAKSNARQVAQVAREQEVDPTVAVAMMLVESGGNERAVGDGGTSFGLFQLHKGGMLTAAGLTSTQAFDPRTNATVALKSLAHEWAKGSARRTPGEIAAASQRPADPVGYARKVEAAMDRARSLLGT